MKFYLSLLFLLGTTLAFAQPPGGGRPGGRDFKNMPAIGKISGIVIDSLTAKPVEFATVSLFRLRNDSLVSGGITNTKGRFLIEELKPGGYKIKIEFIGYQTKIVPRLGLGRNGFEVDLGKVFLQPAATELAGVEVTEKRAFMQNEIDKKVYNVERSLTSEGASANEILETLPSIDVDIDGAISLRGSGNVTVLIDGRPSGLTGASRQAVLDQIPSSSIEAVEVITNPSAKFDPEGMAGIINIVLKKNRKKGISGSVTAGYTTIDRINASAGLNYRTSKFNFFSNYGFRYGTRLSEGSTERTNFLSDSLSMLDTTYSLQPRTGERFGLSHTLRAGMDFYLTPKNTLGFSGTFSTQERNSDEVTGYRDFDRTYTETAYSQRFGIEENEGFNIDANTFYTKKFKRPKQELTLDLNYSYRIGDEFATAKEYSYEMDEMTIDSILDNQRTFENSLNQTTLFKADYIHPMGKKANIETGYHATFRSINNDFDSETFQENEFVVDSNLTNEFLYKEQIQAIYGTYANQFDKYGVKIGLRLEQTFTDSDLKTSGAVSSNDYFSFFPSVHLTRKLKEEQELALSYSRRVNRPSFRSLNPFSDYSDERNIRRGNPNLQPEYIHSTEFGYMKRFRSGTINTNVYYKNTQDAITRFREATPDPDVYILTYRNLAKTHAFGLEFIGTYQPKKWWDMNVSFNIFRSIIKDDNGNEADLANDGFGYLGKITSSWDLWKGAEFQLQGNYRGRRVIAQGNIGAMWNIDGAFKQKFLDNKASFSLRFRDLFNTRQFSFVTAGPSFSQEGNRMWQSRAVSVSLTYLFGKQQRPTRRKRGTREGGSDGGDMDF